MNTENCGIHWYRAARVPLGMNTVSSTVGRDDGRRAAQFAPRHPGRGEAPGNRPHRTLINQSPARCYSTVVVYLPSQSAQRENPGRKYCTIISAGSRCSCPALSPSLAPLKYQKLPPMASCVHNFHVE